MTEVFDLIKSEYNRMDIKVGAHYKTKGGAVAQAMSKYETGKPAVTLTTMRTKHGAYLVDESGKFYHEVVGAVKESVYDLTEQYHPPKLWPLTLFATCITLSAMVTYYFIYMR